MENEEIQEIKKSLETAVKEVGDTMDKKLDGVAKSEDVAKSIDEVKGEFAEKIKEIESSVSKIEIGKNLKSEDPKKGYKSHADFLNDVMKVGKGAAESENLKLCKAVGSDEQNTFSNPDGGFLVPAGFLNETMMSDPFAIQSNTGSMTRRIPMASQIVNVNARVDKNHSSSVTGGLQVYRRKEADSVTSSKMQFEQVELKAESLAGIAYATDEILMASPVSFMSLISSGFAEEYQSKLNDERIRGTGVGEYLGVLNSPALVTIAKESEQSADTINVANVRKMRAQIWGYGNSAWHINQDCYTQIAALGEVAASGSNTSIFQGALSADIPDMLLGRPIIWDENCSTLGDLGDIMLINWREYLEGTYGGATFSESVHVRFVNHETAFKFNVYNAGAPWWRTAVTPKNSASTLSPFVSLAARA